MEAVGGIEPPSRAWPALALASGPDCPGTSASFSWATTVIVTLEAPFAYDLSLTTVPLTPAWMQKGYAAPLQKRRGDSGRNQGLSFSSRFRRGLAAGGSRLRCPITLTQVTGQMRPAEPDRCQPYERAKGFRRSIRRREEPHIDGQWTTGNRADPAAEASIGIHRCFELLCPGNLLHLNASKKHRSTQSWQPLQISGSTSALS